MTSVAIVPASYSKGVGGQKTWELNPDYLWGDDIIVMEEENIAVGTPSIIVYIDLADYNKGINLSVDINQGISLLTAKIYLTNEPGDMTGLTYYQDASLPDLTADGNWEVSSLVRAVKITIDATSGADSDCYIYGSRA